MVLFRNLIFSINSFIHKAHIKASLCRPPLRLKDAVASTALLKLNAYRTQHPINPKLELTIILMEWGAEAEPSRARAGLLEPGDVTPETCLRWDSQRSIPGRGNSNPNPAGLGVGKNLVCVTYWREDNVARAEGITKLEIQSQVGGWGQGLVSHRRI